MIISGAGLALKVLVITYLFMLALALSTIFYLTTFRNWTVDVCGGCCKMCFSYLCSLICTFFLGIQVCFSFPGNFNQAKMTAWI